MDPVSMAVGIGTAAGLGACIGLERELTGQPAGLRTHIILAIGAALASMLSISFSYDFSSPEFRSDPARIVAQVVSGVGFLGAGAIMKFGVNVKGLTTATSLWTTAIIGIACGASYFQAAAIATVCVLLALTIVNWLSSVVLTGYRTREFKVKLKDRPGIINELRTRLEGRNVSILSMNAAMPDKATLKIDMIIRIPSDLKMDALINEVNAIDEMQSVQID
jgi:putative Mg2+ transporter-C (MgtC) family protein